MDTAIQTRPAMLTTVIQRHKIAALLLIVALGLSLRLRGLGSAGFNEDEIQKVVAARSYLDGNFSVNLEHPMVMKSLIAVSLSAADAWNRRFGQLHQISEEFAVRLPNAIFGALTAVVIFLIAQELFSVEIGLLAALLWSIGTIAIMVNRVAKEDTLLAFFTWLAYYFYLRAKNVSVTDAERGGRYYAAAGASFGLMLASKYFPHYLGLNALYHHLRGQRNHSQPLRKRDYVLVFGTCVLVFLLFNPMVLQLSTLRYMLHYVGGCTVTHHGYLMMGRLYSRTGAVSGGNACIFLCPVSRHQDAGSNSGRTGHRTRGDLETQTRTGFIVCPFHVPLVDCPFLAARSQVDPLHACVDAVGIHHCGDRAGQALLLGVRGGPSENGSPAGSRACRDRGIRVCR